MRYLPFLFLFLLFACNPVKQVLRDEEKFEEVAQAVILRGYCANDTTIVDIVTDTVTVYNEPSYVDSLFIQEGLCDFDTVTKRGTRIKFDKGHLFIWDKEKIKTQIVTKRINNYIRDKAKEELLEKKIIANQDTIRFLKGKLESYKEINKELSQKYSKLQLYLAGLIIFILITIAYRIFKKFTQPIL